MAESSSSSTSSESHRNSVGSKSLSSSSSTSTSTTSNSHSDSLASLLPPPLSLLPINPPPLDELYSFAACNPTSDSDRRSSASDADRRESTGSLSSGSSGSNPKNNKNQKSSSESNSGSSSSSEGQNERRRSSEAVDLTPPTSPISRRITIKDRNKPLPQPPVAPISPPESNPRLSGSINDGFSKTSPITPSPSGVGLGLDLDPSKSNQQLPSTSFLAVFTEAEEGTYDPKGLQSGRRRSSFLGLRRKSTSITPNGGSSPLLASPILGGFRSRRKVSMTDNTGDLNSSQEKLSKKESKESRVAKKRSFSTNTHQLQQPLRNPSTSNPGGSALGLLLGGAGAVAYGSPLMGSFGLEKDGKTSNQSSSETDLTLVDQQQRGGSAALASLSIAPLPLDPSLEAAIEKLKKSVLVDSSSSRKPQSNSLTPAQTPKLSTSATSTPKIQQSQSQSPAISERNTFGKSEKLLESVLGDKKEASSPNSFGDLAFAWEEKKDGNSSRRWMGIKSNKIKSKSKGKNESDSPLVNDCSFTSGESTAVSISNAQQSISDNLEASKRAMARLGWVYGSDQVKLFCGRDSKVNVLERLNLDKGNEISAILSDDLSSSSSSLQYRPKPILSPHSTLLRRWSNFTSIYFNSELSLEDLPSFPPPNVPSPVFCPFATPISSGPLSAVAPVWERERQLALDRLELHSLDSSTLEKITSLVMEAKESMKAADAVISILEGEETFVVSGESENGSTVKSPMERASTICGHTLFNRNKGQFVTNVKDDWRFAGGPSAEKWGFYSGMPICNANGMPIATLCTFDHEPRSEVRPSERAALRDIATRIGNELELAYAIRYQAKLKRIQDSYSRLENLLIIDPPPFAQIVGLVSESKAETGIPVRIKLPRYHTQNQKREVKRIARDSSVAGTTSSTPLAALTLDRAGGSVLPFDQQKVGASFSAPSPVVEPLGPEPKLLSLGLHVSKNNQERFDSITTLIAEALQLDTVYLVAFDRRLESKLEDSRRSSSTKVVLQDPKLDSAPSPIKSVATLPTSAASSEASSPTKSKSEQPQPQKQNCRLISYSGASISSDEELDPDLYRRVLSTAEAQGSEDVRGLVFQNRAEIGVDEKIGIGTFSSNKKGLWREASSLPGRRGSSDDGRVFTHQCGIFVAIEVETQAQVSKDPIPTEFSSSSPSVSPQDQPTAQEPEPLKVGFVLSALSSSARRVLGVEDLRYLQAISSALGALILVCQRDGEAEKKKRETIKIELLKQEEILSKAKEAASQKFALRRTISLETTASVPTPSAFVKAPGISTKNRKGLNGKLGKGNLSLALPSVGMGMSLSSAKLSPRLSPRGTPKSEYCPTSPAGQQGLGLSLGSGPKSKQQAAFESYSLGGEQSLDQETSSQLHPKKETMAKAFARKATGAAHTAANTASATASSALNFKMSSVTPSSLMLPTSASKAEKRKNRNSASPITPEFAAGSAPLLSPKSLQPVFSYGYDLPDSVEAQEQAIWKRDMERVEKLSVNMGQGPRRASINGMAPLPSPLEFEPMGALWGGDGLKPSPRMKSSPKSKKSTPSRPTRLPPPRPDQEACLSPPLSPFASASTPPLDQDVNVDLPISPIWSSALLSPDPSLSETTSVLQSHPQMPRKEASRPSLRERRATSVFSLKVTVCDWSEGLNPESQSA